MSSEVLSFDQLSLSAPVLQVLLEIGYENPSPIQAAAIPHLLDGEDIVGQAQTGTGKTAAFALPLLSGLDLKKKQPQILVLTPTRELAIQVAEAFQVYARHLKGFHVTPIYGGQSMDIQLRQLKRGVHVVIGTPGRVMDHLRRKTLKLQGLKTLVLDEADEMLKMGFIDDVEWILEHTPETRQIALFSATMPEAIRRVARRHLNEPSEIKIKTSTATVSTINQRFWRVSGLHKLDALTRILEVEDFDAAIIFVRTKTETVNLAEKLEARGFATAALNGDMNQALRERTITQLKNKKLDIVVATDVAARGLDVQRITHVINYDIPNDPEAYVHRIGRTGRAGRTGNAILFVAPREMRMLRTIEKATRQPIESMHLPSSESVTDKRVAMFKQQIMDVIESEDLKFLNQVVNEIEAEQNLSSLEIASALAHLVQRERPLQVKEPKKKKTAAVREKDAVAPARKGKPARREEGPIPAGKRKVVRENRPAAPISRLKKHPEVELERFRIEVGREQGATPKDIVGAIANEAEIDAEYIGHIKLYDNHSTIDLPLGMPKETFQHLTKVRVRQQPLQISREGEAAGGTKRPKRNKKPAGSKAEKSKDKAKRKANKGKPKPGRKKVAVRKKTP